MQDQIKKYLAQFGTTDKNGTQITIFNGNDTDKELYNSVYAAHGDRLPNDWIFDKYVEILEELQNYEVETTDDIEDNRNEIVDNMVDIATNDLTEWLASHNGNVYYLTQALEENPGIEDGFKLLAIAQYEAIDEIYSEVANLLSE